ncbi:hypothetical protein [Paenibacillus solani]|uniref:hypothetical protein n=1 Tax=Paenibacillus solani TaxID=1705565 RepID=UPI000AC16577|nr:hypothetical protein [Paenibacillus solani]
MTRKRIVLESVLFAAAIYAGCMAFMVVQGMILTQRYVPNLEITSQYEHAQTLQSQVNFGIMEQNSGWAVVTTIGGLILAGGLYGYIRWFFTRRRKQT